MNRKLVLLFFALLSLTSVAFAAQPITQIDLIFDASNSMWGQIEGKAKIEIARTAMNELLKEFQGKKHIYLGLRIYGHLNKKCDNSVLEIKPGANNIEAIRKKVASIKPLGKTPIAYSLQMAAKDFDESLPGKKVIILITDGLESCGGNPCVAAGILKKAGVITKIHVVGFGLKEDALASLNCIAKPFNGKVIGANNTKELIAAFREISKAVAIENNLRVVGIDKNEKPVNANVEIFLNEKSEKQGMGDDVSFTLKKGIYRVVARSVATGEKLAKESVEVAETKATEVKFQFKQGILSLLSTDGDDKEIYSRYQIFQDEKEVSSTEGAGETEKILLPGKYDVKATASEIKKSSWKKGIEIADGETVAAKFKFADAKFILSSDDGKNNEIYVTYKIYKSGTEEEVKSNEGTGKVETILEPGKYDVRAFYSDTKSEQWKKGIELKDGETSELQFRFAQGKFVLSSIDSNNQEIYVSYRIYKEGETVDVKSNEGSGKVEILLVPGRYDIKAYHGDSKSELWEKSIELNGGETVEKQFKFVQGKFVLDSVDCQNTPIYASYRVYKAGTDEDVRGNEGSEKIEILLAPGRYDIKAYHYDSRSELWLKDIELNGGETVEKQFKFAIGKFVVSSSDSSGNAIYVSYRVFKAGTKEDIRVNEGTEKVELIVVPGKYDIRAYHGDTKTEKWEKGIELKDGETIEKQFKF